MRARTVYTIEVAPSVELSFMVLPSLRDRLETARRIDLLSTTPRPSGAAPVDCGIPGLHSVGSRPNRILYQVLDEDMRIVILALGEV